MRKCVHVGDKGQRYEISVFDSGKGERIVVGWTNLKSFAEILASGFESRPSWSDAEIKDRQEPTEPLDYNEEFDKLSRTRLG